MKFLKYFTQMLSYLSGSNLYFKNPNYSELLGSNARSYNAIIALWII
jgi:hypothetical protein